MSNKLGAETVSTLVPYTCGLPITLCYGQLTPEGIIYINSGNGTSCLSYVEFPDSLGSACNVIQHGLSLPFYINYFSTFPNHPTTYRLGDDGSNCDVISSNPILESDELQIFPNPTSGRIILHGLMENQIKKIAVYTLENRKVFESSVSGKEVDIHHLSPGIYIVSVSYRDKLYQKKLIVID